MPFSAPLFKPLAIRLLLILGSAALLLCVAQIVRGSATSASLPSRTLWQRYRSWCIIALLFSSAVLIGPYAMAVLCAFLCWQGGKEYAQLTNLSASSRLLLVASGWLTLIAVLLRGTEALLIAPALAFFSWSGLMLCPLKDHAEIDGRFKQGLAGLWGYLYLGWLPAFLLAASSGQFPGLALVAGAGVALSDVGAFCVGKLLKGPGLAPQLSPAKTWAGVLGNVLGAALALALMNFALPDLPWWQYSLFALIVAFGSIWGDLLESLLKRQHGVKDAGRLLPGFGGLLDRIDSLLLVTPLIYGLSVLLSHK